MAPRVLFLVVGVAALIVACDKSGPSPAPAPSTMPDQSVTSSAPATADAPAVMAQSGVGRLEQRINMHDACDADSFNDAVGPGTCSRNGGVKFDQFINLVMKFHSVGPWNFAPNNLTGHAGETLVAFNQGGETHTFTKVAEFGDGSIAPPLNQVLGNPPLAEACEDLDPDDLVAPGGTYEEEEKLEAGETAKFQCCIHPWMRLEVQVSH
jgi:hypothetical protein